MSMYVYDLLEDGFGINMSALLIPFIIIVSVIYPIFKKGFKRPTTILEWCTLVIFTIVFLYFLVNPLLAYFQYLDNRGMYSEGIYESVEGVVEQSLVKGQTIEEFTVKGVVFEHSIYGGGHYYLPLSDNAYLREGVYVKIKYLSTYNGIVRLEVISQ